MKEQNLDAVYSRSELKRHFSDLEILIDAIPTGKRNAISMDEILSRITRGRIINPEAMRDLFSKMKSSQQLGLPIINYKDKYYIASSKREFERWKEKDRIKKLLYSHNGEIEHR